ncbi:MAG: hypothetical protein EPO32_06015 [Anaerolineae bacterium]|nr:MAG: hypothetical protein EPO32_06015 [Anaerolineae bacterium]
MSEAKPTTRFQCTQCGGDLKPDQGQLFLTCPFCGSTVYLDKSKVVFHWYVAPTLDEAKARGALARWMSGNDTVKDLDKKATLDKVTFRYFPLWHFKQKDAGGKERIVLYPAAATSITEVAQMQLPPGDLRKYEDRLDNDAEPPTVPLEAALEWAEHSPAHKETIVESAVVHVPLYRFKYSYEGQGYAAMVDAASGKVMANIYPEKAETPYQFVGGLAAIVFLGLATFPILGGFFGDGGTGIGFGICTGLGIPAALAIMALAAYVSQKV